MKRSAETEVKEKKKQTHTFSRRMKVKEEGLAEEGRRGTLVEELCSRRRRRQRRREIVKEKDSEEERSRNP